MRVDNPEHNHDHGFGLGADHLATPEVNVEHTAASHGLFDQLGHDNVDQIASHGIGNIEHDFGQHHDTGFDGLHDSVHSIGLGFGGDEHHGLHDGLHDSLHDTQHDAQHLGGHTEVIDTHHHDVGLGDQFHHG